MGSSSSSNRMHPRSNPSVGLYDKENLPNDGHPFIMLRNEDDLDLGGFQMSKSIYGHQNQVNQQQQQKEMGVGVDSTCSSSSGSNHINNSHVQKEVGRAFGTSLLHAPNVHVNQGSYFGFDRTNIMGSSSTTTGQMQRSPMKMHGSSYMNMVVPKVESLDVYATDSNSQASLPTSVSSPASTISYFDAQAAMGSGTRPVMEFLDLNDDYWLEFAQ